MPAKRYKTFMSFLATATATVLATATVILPVEMVLYFFIFTTTKKLRHQVK